jgi:hypothetical protein
MSEFLVITLCGSMRYYDDMLKAAGELTRKRFIVIMPYVADYVGGKDSDEHKLMLDRMHREKIDLASAILVVGTHRGESTLGEIAYAKSQGKLVFTTIDSTIKFAERMTTNVIH